MSGIASLFQHAQLSEAAYADLWNSSTNSVITAPDLVKTALIEAGFSRDANDRARSTQASAFLSQWRVVNHLPDTKSGFSATLFQDIETGRYTFAIRGTNSLADYAADIGDVVLDGIAMDQVVDMFNYWQSLTTKGVYQAAQLETMIAETAQLRTLALGIPLGGKAAYDAYVALLASSGAILDTTISGTTVRRIRWGSSDVVFEGGPGSRGSGELAANAAVDVVGSSLGGHLAAAFTRLFPLVPAQAVTVNGAGFPTGLTPGLGGNAASNIDNLFAALGGAAGFNPGAILNVHGSGLRFISMNSQFGLVQQGTPQEIFIESTFPSLAHGFGHGNIQVTDSLAVYDLFTRIDSRLRTASLDTAHTSLKPMFEAASVKALSSHERLIDGLATLFGLNVPLLLDGNDREELFERIVLLRSAITEQISNRLDLRVEVLAGAISGADLSGISQAFDAVAYRYAVRELNPFAILGSNDLYLAHNTNGELDLYDPEAGIGLTREYLTDRSAMLVNMMARNATDARLVDPGASNATDYIDRRVVVQDSSGARRDTVQEDKVYVGGGLIRNEVRKIAFGSVQGDEFRGSGFDDRLYGGGGGDMLAGLGGSDYLQGDQGGDVLIGGAGDDFLNGGYGLDIYRWDVGDGRDTIRDDDGKGHLIVNGRAVNWAFWTDTNTWISADGRLTFTRNSPLTIRAEDGGEITLEDFRDGDFGIRLTAALPAGLTTRTIEGDQTPVIEGPDPFRVDSNLNVIPREGTLNHRLVLLNDQGPYYQTIDPIWGPITVAFFEYNTLDALGNVNVSGEEPGRQDRIFDSFESDFIRTLGGNDEVILSRGGSDHVQVGEGDDVVSVEPGFAPGSLLLEGGPGSDFLEGGAGDDRIYGEEIVSIEQAFLEGSSIASSEIGDWINAGDGSDIVVGSVRADFLEGGAGEDLLLGGDGNDFIVGDTAGPEGEGNAEPFVLSASILGDVRDTTVYVGSGVGNWADAIYAGGGNDIVRAQRGNDVIDGGDGEDDLDGGGGADILLGGSGNDVLSGDGILGVTAEHGADYLDGGEGDDQLFGDGGADFLFGGDGTDTLIGDRESSLAVQQGDDFLDGGSGDDTLIGGGGTDVLKGDDGNDRLVGGPGDDLLDGGEGDDTYVFNVGDGVDTLRDSGALGFDTLVLGEGITSNDITLGIGSLLIRVGDRGDAIHVEGVDLGNVLGSPIIERVVFSDGETFSYSELVARGFDIFGTDGDDSLEGTSVSDRLRGGAGSDIYFFGHGSGQDLIEDLDEIGFDIDTVQMGSDIAPADLTVNRDADFISLAISGTSDQVSIRWQPDAGYRIERFEFADGTVWSAATVETLSEANSEIPPFETDPRDGTNEPSIPQEQVCRDFIARGNHERQDTAHHDRQRGGKIHGDRDGGLNRKRGSVAERLANNLAQEPRFDFETLLEELEGVERDEYAYNARAVERSWRAVGRFIARHSSEHDDGAQGAAPYLFNENGAFGWSAFTGSFDSQGLLARMTQRAASLQAFRGLEDGFRHLHR